MLLILRQNLIITLGQEYKSFVQNTDDQMSDFAVVRKVSSY